MYLAFIHIGSYDIKARRHLACVQNGITQLGDWRMETWQLALRARCHVSIRQSPSLCNAILNTCPCLLAITTHQKVKNLLSLHPFMRGSRKYRRMKVVIVVCVDGPTHVNQSTDTVLITKWAMFFIATFSWTIFKYWSLTIRHLYTKRLTRFHEISWHFWN